MYSQTLDCDISELLDEAAAARMLAATFSDAAAIRDLLAYAESLEADASWLREQSTIRTAI